MTKSEALANMISPGMSRLGKPMGGVIQIWVTRACDKACFNCTQGSNFGGKFGYITLEQFEQAVISLRDYFGIVGVFGGNPAMHPKFDELCEILRNHIPYERRGLWCNRLFGHGDAARKTFNPAVSNLNVHLDQDAYDEFKREWPESRPFGLHDDSRHSPVYTALQDLIPDEGKRWDLIADCDINKHWSAMIGVFRGQLRGYFCEIAGAQAMLHQLDPEYPDLGVPVVPEWWRGTMQEEFATQATFHCHACGVPLRGYGELAQSLTGVEQVSETHREIAIPKKSGRNVQVVTSLEEVQSKGLKFNEYLQGASK